VSQTNTQTQTDIFVIAKTGHLYSKLYIAKHFI